MHGLYKIKVVDKGTALFEYYACTHPTRDQALVSPEGKTYSVGMVRHVLREGRNGTQKYVDLSHVEVQVQ